VAGHDVVRGPKLVMVKAGSSRISRARRNYLQIRVIGCTDIPHR
jgi:hypothetical protein